jgi:hypothetical protein
MPDVSRDWPYGMEVLLKFNGASAEGLEETWTGLEETWTGLEETWTVVACIVNIRARNR